MEETQLADRHGQSNLHSQLQLNSGQQQHQQEYLSPQPRATTRHVSSPELEVQQPAAETELAVRLGSRSEIQSDTTELMSETDREMLQTDTESEIQSENEPEMQSEETASYDQSEAGPSLDCNLNKQAETEPGNDVIAEVPKGALRESNSATETQRQTQPEASSKKNSGVLHMGQASQIFKAETASPSDAQLAEDQVQEVDGQADDGQADDGQPDDGQPVDGQADDGQADDGQADDGQADDGQPDDGQPDDGQPDDSQPDDGQPDDGQPEVRSEAAALSEEKHKLQPQLQPKAELGERLEEPEAQSEARQEADPDAKPEAELDEQTVLLKLSGQPEAEPELNAIVQSDHKVQPEVQPEAEPEKLPEVQPDAEVQPRIITTDQSDFRQEEAEVQPEAEPEFQCIAQSQAQPIAQSNVELAIQQPLQPELLNRRHEDRQDVIIPPASRYIRNSQSICRKPQHSLSSLRRLPAAASRNSSVLSLPYPIEQCGAEMQRTFPGQIGRFYVTNPYCYAYTCNRMSIEIAAESIGFDKRSFLGAVQPPESEQQRQQQQEAEQEQQPVASGKSLERRMDDLEQDLARDPRLTLMILKPSRMNWNKLGNCLIFERSHPHRHYIADKWQMFLVLRRSATLRHLQLTTASGRPFDYNNFILYTANPGYYQLKLLQYLDSHPGIYILKRTNYSQGIGIRIYRAERPNTIDRLRNCAGNRASLNQFVLQKYIERPLLVDKRKFDLRVYMMLLSCKRPAAGPGGGFEYSYFAFCYPGYVKLSCYPYSRQSRDMHVHLTNQFVQKQRWSLYTRVKEATTWFPDELNAYLNRRGRAEVDWCKNTLYSRIRAIVGYVAAAFQPHLESNASPASVFRLYGPDFIIDEDLNVWLLEVNTFPSYSKNTAALSGSIRNMWREAVTVATETTLRYRNRLPVNGLTTVRNFRLAYSSEDPGLLGELVKESFA